MSVNCFTIMVKSVYSFISTEHWREMYAIISATLLLKFVLLLAAVTVLIAGFALCPPADHRRTEFCGKNLQIHIVNRGQCEKLTFLTKRI